MATFRLATVIKTNLTTFPVHSHAHVGGDKGQHADSYIFPRRGVSKPAAHRWSRDSHHVQPTRTGRIGTIDRYATMIYVQVSVRSPAVVLEDEPDDADHEEENSCDQQPGGEDQAERDEHGAGTHGSGHQDCGLKNP